MIKPLKTGMLAAAATLVVASGADAGDMSGLFGNTILCTHADGSVAKVYTEAGGTFTVVRNGQTIQGKWVDDGATVCYTETNPASPPGVKPVCISSAPKKVGDTWPVIDPGGGCTAVLAAGHQ